jgi:hypothetical protein
MATTQHRNQNRKILTKFQSHNANTMMNRDNQPHCSANFTIQTNTDAKNCHKQNR